MRYYCKNCLTIFDFASGTKIPVEYLEKILQKQKEMGIKDKCCVCGSFLERLPFYETPEQYEKRTGKAFPDNGLVWAKRKDGSRGLCEISEWGVWFFERAVKNNLPHIVIADPPTPPPDNWEPEETK